MRLPKYRRRGSFVRVGGCLRSLRALRWCRLPAAAFLACPSSPVCLRTLRTRCWRRFDDGRFSGVSEFAGLPAGLCGCFRFACLPACLSLCGCVRFRAGPVCRAGCAAGLRRARAVLAGRLYRRGSRAECLGQPAPPSVCLLPCDQISSSPGASKPSVILRTQPQNPPSFLGGSGSSSRGSGRAGSAGSGCFSGSGGTSGGT